MKHNEANVCKKALAISYVWWPRTDYSIVSVVKDYGICKNTAYDASKEILFHEMWLKSLDQEYMSTSYTYSRWRNLYFQRCLKTFCHYPLNLCVLSFFYNGRLTAALAYTKKGSCLNVEDTAMNRESAILPGTTWNYFLFHRFLSL